MDLIIRMTVVDKNGHEVAEKSAQIENFSERDSFGITGNLRQWVMETFCSLKVQHLSRKDDDG